MFNPQQYKVLMIQTCICTINIKCIFDRLMVTINMKCIFERLMVTEQKHLQTVRFAYLLRLSKPLTTEHKIQDLTPEFDTLEAIT